MIESRVITNFKPRVEWIVTFADFRTKDDVTEVLIKAEDEKEAESFFRDEMPESYYHIEEIAKA